MHVSQIMTPDPIRVSEGTPLDAALKLMDENGIRHLPVVEGARLVGILSDRDLLEATGWLPSRVHACRGPATSEKLPKRVGEIFRSPVVTIPPGESLASACREFVHRGIGCLPVVEDAALVGIVTEMDLLRTFAEKGSNNGWLKRADPPVSEHMTKAPMVVHWYSPLKDVVTICRSNNIRHIPVMDPQGLVGMLSDRDLRRAIGRGRPEDTPIDEFMTRDLVTIRPESRLSEAATLMSEGKFSALPVVDQEDLVGILTASDILTYCLDTFGEQAAGTRPSGPSAA
jgi:acetoin utilization protein AcuB